MISIFNVSAIFILICFFESKLQIILHKGIQSPFADGRKIDEEFHVVYNFRRLQDCRLSEEEDSGRSERASSFVSFIFRHEKLFTQLDESNSWGINGIWIRYEPSNASNFKSDMIWTRSW